MEMIKQGAEARIYRCQFLGRSTVVKERFSKTYRHPVLDKTLTLRRIRAEVKCIQRCRANGILCPAIYFVDLETNKIFMEDIVDSTTVKDYIIDVQTKVGGSEDDTCAAGDAAATTTDDRTVAVGSDHKLDRLLPLAHKIGQLIGTMHRHHIIHGDLTTSNMLLVGRREDLRIALIDFGLASVEESAEDKGVDLYVLERALLSTHPSSEPLFEGILESYRTAFVSSGDSAASSKKCRAVGAGVDDVLRKLDEIRLRGRKRTMVG